MHWLQKAGISIGTKEWSWDSFWKVFGLISDSFIFSFGHSYYFILILKKNPSNSSPFPKHNPLHEFSHGLRLDCLYFITICWYLLQQIILWFDTFSQTICSCQCEQIKNTCLWSDWDHLCICDPFFTDPYHGLKTTTHLLSDPIHLIHTLKCKEKKLHPCSNRCLHTVSLNLSFFGFMYHL